MTGHRKLYLILTRVGFVTSRFVINSLLYLVAIPFLFYIIGFVAFHMEGETARVVADIMSTMLILSFVFGCVIITVGMVSRVAQSNKPDLADTYLSLVFFRLKPSMISDFSFVEEEYLDGSKERKVDKVSITSDMCMIDLGYVSESPANQTVVVYYGKKTNNRMKLNLGEDSSFKRCRSLRGSVSLTDVGGYLIRKIQMRKVRKLVNLIDDMERL